MSTAPVAVAQARDHDATHVTFRQLNGVQDWRLMSTIRDENRVFVTNNRADFLKPYAQEDIHSGLIVIVPSVPRDGQIRLFELALDVLKVRGDLVNTLIEVHEDGRVDLADWFLAGNDPKHLPASSGRTPSGTRS